MLLRPSEYKIENRENQASNNGPQNGNETYSEINSFGWKWNKFKFENSHISILVFLKSEGVYILHTSYLQCSIHRPHYSIPNTRYIHRKSGFMGLFAYFISFHVNADFPSFRRDFFFRATISRNNGWDPQTDQSAEEIHSHTISEYWWMFQN